MVCAATTAKGFSDQSSHFPYNFWSCWETLVWTRRRAQIQRFSAARLLRCWLERPSCPICLLPRLQISSRPGPVSLPTKRINNSTLIYFNVGQRIPTALSEQSPPRLSQIFTYPPSCIQYFYSNCSIFAYLRTVRLHHIGFTYIELRKSFPRISPATCQ